MIDITSKGGPELQAALERMASETPDALRRSLRRVGDEVMTRSKAEFCPVDKGTLIGTGRMTEASVSDLSVRLVYGGPAAPYALSVHENPRSGKTGGWGPSGPRETAFRWVTRGGKRFVAPIGAQRQHWARRGQWKYLEAPVLQASKDFPERLGRLTMADLERAKR